MVTAQTKAVRRHRSRMRKRGMKRIEIVVRNQDAALLRAVAARLRRDDASAHKLRTALRNASQQSAHPSIADVMHSLPDISGPDFDDVFQQIEQFRHHPMMKQVRDVDL